MKVDHAEIRLLYTVIDKRAYVCVLVCVCVIKLQKYR